MSSAPPPGDHDAPYDDPIPIARHRTTQDQRVPPHDMEAEEALLGAMLLNPDATATALNILTGDEYYKPAHQTIHHAIRRLHDHQQPIDPITVADDLRRHDQLDPIGGPGTLIALQMACPATGNAGRYARIISDLDTYRRAIAAAAAITEIAYAAPDDLDGALSHIEQATYNLRPSQHTAVGTRQLDTIIHDVVNRLLERAETGDRIDGIATGWTDLDHLLLGLSPGDITVLGARPGMGKSQWAAVLAWQVANAGHPVLFASLEMKAEELGKRWLGTVSRVKLQDLRAADLDDSDWALINASLASFEGVPVHVLDNYGAGVSAIAHAARKIGVTGGLVIVDYAQLVTPGTKGLNRNNEVAEISRALKLMAGDLGCHVVLLSQLSRQLESRADKRPMLSDLRDSGALEQDASNVIFLYRDEVYSGASSPDRGVMEVIVEKQRNGPQGRIRLAYAATFGLIRDIGYHTPGGGSL